MTLTKQKTASISKQRGQAAVLVVLFSAILVTSAFAMFKAGKLTTNKMQLQNAADAAAYSMSVVEARDLNFASYMNKAIVANEVAIGQFVGLASWAYHFKSFADYIDFYNFAALSPLTLGASNAFVTPITSAWRGAGQTAVNIMNKLANAATLVFHNINKIYGTAEYGYHIVSVVQAIGVLDDVITQNGAPGTKVSDFGVISLIAHVATYGVLPDLPGEQFVNSYNSGWPVQSLATKVDVDEFEESAYARLSAIIRDSRDPFTMARGWELRPPGFPIDRTGDKGFSETLLNVAIAKVGIDVEFYFDISLERKGASELRFVLPDSGEIKAAQYANWSSADATGLFVDIFFSFYVWGQLCDPVFGSGCTSKETIVGGELDFGDSTVSLKVSFAGFDITIIDDLPFPTAAPFGSGFAEIGKNSPNNLGNDDMALSSMGGVIDTEHYGEAPNNMLAWVSPGPGQPNTPPIGVQFAAGPPYETTLGSRFNKSYAGLPSYVDTTGDGPFLGVGAPNILIGLVQDEADFDTYYNNDGSVEDSSEPEGRFKLNEALADNELAVLAKSELYFARPTDSLASHFHRADGYTEMGSAFNPYWQARLVDTSYADRTLGLAIQQKQDFISLSNSFNTLLNKLSSILPF